MGAERRSRDELQRILDLLARGALDVAHARLERLAPDLRDHADAWNARALLACASSDAQGACEAFAAAVARAPGRADLRANHAAALLAAGRVEDALRQSSAALAAQPELLAALLTHAAALFANKELARSRAAFEQALALDRECVPAHNGLGDCLREAGQFVAAREAYQRALTLAPDDLHASTNLGPLLLDAGYAENALALCRRATVLAPDDGRTWLNLGYCLAELGRLEEAMEAYAEAHERMPGSALLACHIAQGWVEVGDHAQAQRWIDQAEAAEPGRVGNRVAAARLLLAVAEAESARELLEPLAVAHPEQVQIWLILARARWDDGDAAAAIAACERALALHPGLARTHVSIGEVLVSAGDLEGAAASYRRALALNPSCVGALCGLAAIARASLPQEDLDTMRRLRGAAWLSESGRTLLHAALAQHADASGDAGAAVAYLREANALQWERRAQRDWRYHPDEFRTQVDRLIDCFDARHFARVAGWGASTRVPVFVVGMPRSGTTLTEQILASHPLVLGVGERAFAQRGFQRLAAATGATDSYAALAALEAEAVASFASWHLGELDHLASRDPRAPAGIHHVVDKMPDNYLWLGWIATLFPGARVVHVRRDPRDIALSCWITSFAEIPWACRLEHIAERLIEKERLMAHWRRVLPVTPYELCYENLVADPEREVRGLLDSLELPWDPDCLRFSTAPRLVRTASVLQVRQSVYRRSVERWRRYADALAPLIARLEEAGVIAPAEIEPGDAGSAEQRILLH